MTLGVASAKVIRLKPLSVALPQALARQIERIDARLPAAAVAAAALADVGDPGHDWSHVARCASSALAIGTDVGADLTILLPAVFFHDCVNLRKDDIRRREAAALSACRSRGILGDLGYGENELIRITSVIAEHSYTVGVAPTSLEAAVLQDVDKLDAIGAIGVMRAVTCGVRLGTSFYDPCDPGAEDRSFDDRTWIIDHFSQKLMHLHDAMHTRGARREAARRTKFLQQFLEQLLSEVETCEIVMSEDTCATNSKTQNQENDHA